MYKYNMIYTFKINQDVLTPEFYGGKNMTEPNTPLYINPLILHRADPFIFKHTDGYYYFTASHTDAEHNLDGKYQYRKILIRRAASINDLSDSVCNYSER